MRPETWPLSFSDIYVIMLTMKHRDYVNRLVRTKNGEKYWIKVERVIFEDKTIHRILPDYLLPYKHYERDIIEGAVLGIITPETLGFEDFPCELTVKRWKHSQNKQVI